MNKTIIAIIVVVVVIAGGLTAYFLIAKPGTNPDSITSTQSTTLPTAGVKACDILTDSIAKSLIGPDFVKPDGSVGNISTADIAVSNCNYITKIDVSTTTASVKSSGLSVLARVAKTASGASDNKLQFDSQPTGSENVTGIGDKAFYNPTFRQLNVLKGSNWYIVTYYIDAITNANLDSDKQLAQKLIYK
jgi:hypothetical protein